MLSSARGPGTLCRSRPDSMPYVRHRPSSVIPVAARQAQFDPPLGAAADPVGPHRLGADRSPVQNRKTRFQEDALHDPWAHMPCMYVPSSSKPRGLWVSQLGLFGGVEGLQKLCYKGYATRLTTHFETSTCPCHLSSGALRSVGLSVQLSAASSTACTALQAAGTMIIIHRWVPD